MSEIKSSLDDSGIYRTRKRPFTLSRMLESILEAGRDVLERSGAGKEARSGRPEDLGEQCRVLLVIAVKPRVYFWPVRFLPLMRRCHWRGACSSSSF